MEIEIEIEIELFENAKLVAYGFEKFSDDYIIERLEKDSYQEIIFGMKIVYEYGNESYTRKITDCDEYYYLSMTFKKEIIELYVRNGLGLK